MSQSPQSSDNNSRVVVVSYHGEPFCLLNDADLHVLPVATSACTTSLWSSPDGPHSINFLRPRWTKVAWLTISIQEGCAKHWISIRGYSSSPSSSSTLKAPPSLDLSINATNMSLVASTLAQCEALLCDECAEYRITIMSEPDLSTCVVHENTLAAPAGAPTNTMVAHQRMLLATSPEEMATAVGEAMQAILHGGMEAPTRVCWPPRLAFPVNIHCSNDVARRQEHQLLRLPPRTALLHDAQALTAAPSLKKLIDGQSPTAAHVPSPAPSSRALGHLLSCPHQQLRPPPLIEGAELHVVSGPYDYYHYRVDGFTDDGWGCAYRSLQTLLSWFMHAGLVQAAMPSVTEIQRILSRVDPEKASRPKFVGSRDWIGSFEVMLVLQHFIPGLECLIRRLERGSQLNTDAEVQHLLMEHFRHPRAAPVMIGGNGYAHTIAGIYINPDTMEARYLIVDPHYSATTTVSKTVLQKGFVGWKEAGTFFADQSWYNLCIPLAEQYDPS